MTNRSLMNGSTHNKRRQAIIMFIFTILVMGVVSGFGGTFVIDNTIYKATVGETIVMEAAPPQSGTPADYDALSNLKYAAYKLHHTSFFRGETDGVAVADIGFTTYSQHLTNTRVVLDENTVFSETISSSSLKNLGEQKYADGDIVIYRPSVKVKDGVATFADTAYPMTYEEFADGYGTIPNQLSKYIIDENTILSVRDDNAPAVASARNSQYTLADADTDGMGIDFYVPEHLVADADGNYTFTLTLDPESSSRYYRNEVRTLAGADTNPKFYSVRITVVIDKDWNPIKVTTVENYDIAIPVLGAMNCTGTNVETFCQLNDPDGSLPYKEFFQPYVDAVRNNPDYVSPNPPPAQITSPADYLAGAFADYLNGEKPLELDVDISSDAISAYGLIVSADLATLNVKAMLDNLYIEYSGDNVNIMLGDLNGYIPMSKFKDIMKNDELTALLAGLGDLSNFDIQSVFGGDMLGTVFGNCDMTTENGVTRIHMPFAIDLASLGLDDKAEIDASVYIDNESMALKSITADITFNGIKLTVSAKPPRRAPRFPSTDGATDISNILDFVPDIIATARQKTFGVSGTVSALGYDIGINGYIDITDGIKADVVLSTLGLDISVKYAEGTIYIAIGNIEVRGTADEIPALINTLMPLLGDNDISEYLDKLKLVMPTTVSDYINMVKTLSITDNTFNVGLTALTIPVSVSLTRGNGKLCGIDLSIAADSFGIKFDAAASLALTYPEHRDIAIPDGDNYLTVTQLAELIPDIVRYISANGYDVALDIAATINGARYDVSANLALGVNDGLSINGTVSALGQTAYITYIADTAYIALGNIKLALDVNKLDSLIAPLSRILDIPELPAIDVKALLSTVDHVSMRDDVLALSVLLNGEQLEITVDLASGTISAIGNVNGIALDVTATIVPSTDAHEITAPDGGKGYLAVDKLGVTIDTVADILECKSLETTATINIDGVRLALDIAANFADGLKLRIIEKSFGLTATVIGTDFYVSFGAINVKGTLDDIPALLNALGDLIPSDIRGKIDGLFDGRSANGDTDITTTLAAVLKTIQSITETDGTLSITAMYDNIGIMIDAATALDSAYVAFAIDSTTIHVDLADISAVKTNIVKPAGEYVELAKLIPTVRKAVEIITEKALTASLNVTFGNTELLLDVAADFTDGLKLRISETTLGLTATVIDKTVYITLGDIRIAGGLNDVPALLDALGDIVPENIKTAINGIIDGDLLPTDTDITDIIRNVVNSVVRFTEHNDVLGITVSASNANIALDLIADLSSVYIAVEINDASVSVSATNIKVEHTDISVNGDYALLRDLTAILSPIVPLIDAQAFGLNIDAELFGVNIRGDIYMYLGGASTPFAVEAQFTVGDLPINATIENGVLYVSIGNTLRVYEELSEPALIDLADKLDYAIPGVKAVVEEIIEQFKAMTLQKFLGCVSLAPTANGVALKLDMTDIGMDVIVMLDADTAGGTWRGLSLDCNISGTQFGATLGTVIENGTLTGFTSIPTEGELFDKLEITIARRGYHNTVVDAQNYIPLSDITRLIAPLVDTVQATFDAKSSALTLNAQLATPNNAYTAISGKVILSFDPIAVDATITVFAGTPDATDISVVYSGSALYIKTGNIALSLDTAQDFERLYNVLAEYLPAYINHEIAKLFGLEQGASAFSDISLIIDRFKAVFSVPDTATAIGLLFKPLEGINSDSALKTVLDMVSVFERDKDITVGLAVMGITLNLTPKFAGEYSELIGASADTNIMGYSIKLDVTDLNLAAAAPSISTPNNAADYVSVIEFIEAINNAVHTFTQKDADGNITFELTSFDFDYEIYALETTTDADGNTVNVKDEAGRDKPLTDGNGNKVIAKTIKVYNKPGYSALKGKFIADDTLDADGNVVSTTYRFNLEAHIVLDINTLKNSTPLTLDLYVVNTDGNGIAFLDYLEGNGNGERISIDYTSIMQILAAALDIMGMDDEVTEMLLGEYRLNIDKTVFDSMDIAGLDSVKELLANLVAAVYDIGDALDYAASGWDLIATAESIDGLNARIDDIKDKFTAAIDKLKTALAVLGIASDEQPTDGVVTETPLPEKTEINGKLFNQIVNGITLKKDETHIWATIDNTITTNTDGESSVTVTQSDGKIRSIGVSGLDVNTAKLDNFDAQFTAGGDVTVALPDNYNTTQGNCTYSDFSNIKHLLFDVMNTANMLEFEIGDIDNATSENKIELGVNLLGVESIKVDIKYNVKVRIIDQGVGANPRYKTAAVVELAFKNCSALGATIISDGTTRLYFYDNVLYVRGKEWYSYQTGTIIKRTEWATRDVSVAYTVDQLGAMLSSDNGMDKLMREFIFYLLPLSRNFTIFKIDLQDKIAESVSTPSEGTPAPTIATVFKGYTYDNGKHDIKIGLSELAEAPGSNMLGDLNVSFTGMNNDDDNILDNYISSAGITLSLINNSACTINLRLYASLRNASIYDNDGVPALRSLGLTNTADGYALERVIDTVIPNTDWQYIWA